MALLKERDWHALSTHDVLVDLATDGMQGLSDAESGKRLNELGKNELPQPKTKSLIALFFDQMKSPLIYLLLGAAAIALMLGHFNDAIIIASVVLLNAIIGAFQEGRAKRSLDSLRKFSEIQACVMRNGIEHKIDASLLVPGDVIVIATGDAIAADARLLDSRAFKTSEGHLTGESIPVAKHSDVVVANARVSERANILYAGTHAVSGRARAVVMATGVDTELGKIAKLSEAPTSEETPLEKKIAQFGKNVLVIAAVVLVSMISAGLLRGIAFGEILIIAISQIVGLIPEGLPIAVTVAHAVAVQRMAKRRALTRKLSALEALGSVDVICTDKTGTLTENEMTVRSIRMLGRLGIDVTGAGYDPVGDFFEEDKKLDPAHDTQLQTLLRAAALCNDAKLTLIENSWRSMGDPTEIALLTVAKKARLDCEDLYERYARTGELPFDSSIKMMATAHTYGEQRFIALKGAPEAILGLCNCGNGKDGIAPLRNQDREELVQTVDALAKRALRVIAVAMVENAHIDERTTFESLRGKAVFLGFLAQIDPPRAEVKESIKKCLLAGIKPVMVTGDHKETGRAIAQELGLDGDAIDGEELEKISDDELNRHIDRIGVFARVLPAQKLRIVNAFKARNNVVAMTGDGVNDAPALVRADVGVAMGESGTEVAKEAAKIVITDDNFATIVSAIEQGRVVYQNIQKAILLLISTAAAETLILFLAIALGYPPPFTAVQILWINLVTETAIVLNLVMDPPEGNEMSMPPIPRLHALVPTDLMWRITGMTSAIVASSLGWFIYRIEQGVPVMQAQTEAFTMLVVCDWFNVLNCRSRLRSAFSPNIFKNAWLVAGLGIAIALQGLVLYWRPLGDLFHTVPISLATARWMVPIAFIVVGVEEGRKLIARIGERKRTQRA